MYKNRLLSRIPPTMLHSMGAVFFVRIFQILMGLASTYVLVRALSQESFGYYQFILTMVAFFSLLAFKGLNESVTQAMARGFSGTARAAATLPLKGALLASLLLLGMAAWYHFTAGSRELVWGFALAALLFLPLHGMTLWKSIMQGQDRFPALMKLEGLNTLVMNGAIVVLLLLWSGNILIPLACILGIPAAQNLYRTFTVFRSIPANAPVEAQNITYGIKSSFYQGVNVVARYIDKIMIFVFLSPEKLAIFYAAERLTDLMRNAVQDMAVVLAPHFARHPAFTHDLDRVFKLFSLVFGSLIIAFAFTLLPPITIFIFGEAYAGAVPYAQALACSIAIGNTAVLRSRYIRSKLDAVNFRDVTLWTSLARIVSVLVLVPVFGMAGAVAAAYIYRISSSIMIERAIRRDYLPPSAR